MIRSHDRSYYIGASDTSHVVGNWNTKTFAKWWRTKQGYDSMDFTNAAMLAGTAYEHKILDALGIPNLEKDKQIISGHLRINLDGNTPNAIYEVKTYKLDKGFKVPLNYKRQVYVEMFGLGVTNAYIVAYGLVEADYKNFYRDIDKQRLSFYQISYDKEFIENNYLPKFSYLSHCLDEGLFPCKIDKVG